jgi:hypothetical protein
MNEYFDDLDKWRNSFECNCCGELNQDNFAYERTVSNGEV